MTYLTKVTEEYRADTEPEAQTLIDEAKHNSLYMLDKYSAAYKVQKAKGEILDEYYLVSLTKIFTDPKEPNANISVSYRQESAF